MNKKRIAVLMAVVLLIGVAAGATLAWLKAGTGTVQNVFTVGDIDIKLTENADIDGNGKLEDSEKDLNPDTVGYHVVPGDKLIKSPKVTFTEDSEACYLFVKMVVEHNAKGEANPIIDFFVNSDWGTAYKAVAGNDGYTFEVHDNRDNYTANGTYYFYRALEKGEATKESQSYYILGMEDTTAPDYAKFKDGYIYVNDKVTKEMLTGDGNILANQPSVSFSAAAVQSKNIIDDYTEEIDKLNAVVAELPTGEGKFIDTTN